MSQHWSRLLPILAIGALPLSGSAGQSASVTVSFTVYVPPSAEERTPRQSRRDEQCDILLASSERPEVNHCRQGLVVYTWREQDENTLLTIAPI